MIEGYFDPAGRPYVRAYVVVPGLQPVPEATALLLDTGAGNTFIQPAGARILGISTQDLIPTGTSRGIGAQSARHRIASKEAQSATAPFQPSSHSKRGPGPGERQDWSTSRQNWR